MKSFYYAGLLLISLLFSSTVNCQLKRICIMGSSTAAGYFPDGTSIDSSWAVKVKKYYKAAGIIDTIYNIAASGRDCYTGMPTDYVPPAGRYTPDPLFNITRAVNFYPKPDVIIINFPSNNYEWMSNEEILFCLKTMRDTASAHGIRCFITTTQPRDYNQLFQREKLRTLKGLIEAEFGVYSIDFWTAIVQDPPIVINPDYAFGDGVHLNPAGHTILANIVIQKNIFFSPVAIYFGDFSTSQQNGIVKLSWTAENMENSDYFEVQRSRANEPFQTISIVNKTVSDLYNFNDFFPATGENLYRIKMSKNGIANYSNVSMEFVENVNVVTIDRTVTNDIIKIMVQPGRQVKSFSVVNSLGQIVYSVRPENSSSVLEYCISLKKFPSGIYYIKVGGENKTFAVMKSN